MLANILDGIMNAISMGSLLANLMGVTLEMCIRDRCTAYRANCIASENALQMLTFFSIRPVEKCL